MKIKRIGKLISRNINIKDDLHEFFSSYENYEEIKLYINSHTFILSRVSEELEFFVCSECDLVAEMFKAYSKNSTIHKYSNDYIKSINLTCKERIIKKLLE
jgi:hypothetical protein